MKEKMKRHSKIDVIIPVAGKGTRLYPHTHSYQKCLLPVGGQPILGHIISNLNGLSINKIKLITGHFENQVKEYVNFFSDYDFECITQNEQLGLAHAIKLGLEYSDNPVLIILGDSIFNIDFISFCNNNISNIGVVEVEDPERYGIIEIENNKIKKFIEKPKFPKSNLAQIGVYFIQSQKLLLDSINHLINNGIMKNNEYQLPDAFQNMLDRGINFNYTKIDNYLDCGIIKTILSANKKILGLKNLNYISKKSTIINSNIKYCSISAGCKVENSKLNNVILLENTIVKNKEISNAIIGSYSNEIKEKDAYVNERNVY